MHPPPAKTKQNSSLGTGLHKTLASIKYLLFAVNLFVVDTYWIHVGDLRSVVIRTSLSYILSSGAFIDSLLKAFHCDSPKHKQLTCVVLMASLTTYDVYYGEGETNEEEGEESADKSNVKVCSEFYLLKWTGVVWYKSFLVRIVSTESSNEVWIDLYSFVIRINLIPCFLYFCCTFMDSPGM